MPAVSGLELAHQILLQKPGFPIIMCTGYSETVSPEVASATGIRGYLNKPVDYAEMAALIRDCASNSPPKEAN